MVKGRGFWFNSETGQIKDVLLSSHIKIVMAEPETFGVTAGFIAQQFELTGEKVGFEGEARRRILLEVLEHSRWVRWRETGYESCHWSIEAWTRKKWDPRQDELTAIVRAYSGDDRPGWDSFELRFLR